MISTDQYNHICAQITTDSVMLEAILRSLSKEQLQGVAELFDATLRATISNMPLNNASPEVIEYTKRLGSLKSQALAQITENAA